MNGKIVVIEGLDGCGKSTQFELLAKFLEGITPTKAISFPDYSNPSSTLVKLYLNGDISNDPTNINAYAASSFYACDRYCAYKKFWQSDYEQGKLILAARYTTSNAIYQMTKLDQNQWDNYLSWLEDYEYSKLELPKPDKTIFLDLDLKIAQENLKKRYNGDENKKDIHERDIEFLKNCRKTALYVAEKLGWNIVKCDRDGKFRTIEDINAELREIIMNMKGESNA